MFALWLSGLALAAAPEVVVVGLHVPGRDGDAAVEDAARLAEALEATGKVDALSPAEAGARIAGRETLILDAYALGPGRERLREGRVLYDRAQPDQAIPVLEQAADLLAAGLAVSTDARDLHEALTLLAMAHVGMGNETQAKAAFRRSATLDPSRQLDAVNFPPRVIELFDATRAELTKASPAHVEVRGAEGAIVWVDGRRVGTAPLADVPVVAGEHYVLVRDAEGRSHFATVAVDAGGRATVDASGLARTLGEPAGDAAGKSRQVRELYRSVGTHTDRAVVLLGGVTSNGQVAAQLYSPASGHFSRAMTGDAGGDPAGAIADLAPALVGYLTEQGEVRPDRVSTQVVALDVSTNDVLAGMLLNPQAAKPQVVEVTRGPKWWVWAGIGALAAGGGAAAVVALTGDDEPSGTQVKDDGTIVFGPVP